MISNINNLTDTAPLSNTVSFISHFKHFSDIPFKKGLLTVLNLSVKQENDQVPLYAVKLESHGASPNEPCLKRRETETERERGERQQAYKTPLEEVEANTVCD